MPGAWRPDHFRTNDAATKEAPVSRHTAAISWRLDGDFADNSYSRRHVWRFDGGAEVIASASPDVVPVPRSDPAGVDPEEALVASAASCHMLWFLDLARQAGLVVESYKDEAVAEMGRTGPGRIAITRITLRPRIAFAGGAPDQAALDRLHHEAHERCFIATTLNCEIAIES
jgi:organic hydroperoxide reductase OsmC/OhrA